MIKAILFDLDGVLVDMPNGHYEALNRALGLFGAAIELEEHYNSFNGLSSRKKIQMLEESGRLPVGLMETVNNIKQKYTKEIIPKYCIPNYSKIIMLKELKRRGFALACVSNSIRETLHYMLKSAQLFDHFDFIIGNDEVKKTKPDPEIYLSALQKMNLRPEECVAVEDAPHGIASAKASGVKVIEVRDVQDVDISLFDDLTEVGG
ncbi:MAG: HAD family hydrolase [Candidatus Magasanikbacteria bacterium RIFOXYC2_FULL_42_28]|uniref:HAD family hydrolase n=1 Tax=Candidatus Magasanikbacteria bacterium RIFOXYC2_FULL_42_28 TaxID=1798704 RepID=A0A1F6NXU4_9BACT|nr:MAG: HAD family hydrolase [Candidatus Magasanikbacteria bacterium RIFOXYC2_FULL_42_28]